jgi:hypothetical protein
LKATSLYFCWNSVLEVDCWCRKHGSRSSPLEVGQSTVAHKELECC